MTKPDLTRQEEFKRATAGAVRAMAQVAEVTVAFQPGPAGVSGKRARLPLPTRALPPAEMAKLRGAADAVALKLRHHDEAAHAARAPSRREAREVFDALEDVRVQAVGSRHMAGVAANLRARLNDECEAEGFDRMTRKDQLPLHSALALMARARHQQRGATRRRRPRAGDVAGQPGRKSQLRHGRAGRGNPQPGRLRPRRA